MRRPLVRAVRDFRSEHPWMGMHLVQGSKFVVVGGMGACIDLCVLWAQVRVYGVPPEAAVVVSASVALCTVFLLNKHCTFRGRRGTISGQILRFAATRSLSLCLNIGLSVLFIRLGAFYLFARAFAILVVMTWNYVAMHAFVFRHRSSL